MVSLKENWLLISIIFIFIFFLYSFLGGTTSETKGKWQAVYYPDGCLDCQEKYIFSPFFETVNKCIDWVHLKASERNNNVDAAECSFDCRTNYDLGGIQVCKETVDVLGNPSL
jgi:hypothetical protein